MSRIVIIGAGHGGTQAAASLREESFAGEIVLISEEDDLPYHKPPLSKSFMKTADAPLQPLRAEAFFTGKKITLRLGRRVGAIDRAERTIVFTDGDTLGYDRLVLATGTKARRLTVPGADFAGVHHLRTAADARAMRAGIPESGHVVVIGGGFIGLEAAAMLAARGLAVTVAELAPRLLERAVSAAAAGAVKDHLEKAAIRVRCATRVDRLVGKDGRISGVALADGELLPADMVVVGIGAVPDVALAQAAGLHVQKGIVTDSCLATSDPLISAIGDCAVLPHPQTGRLIGIESVQNATDQARALAKILTGKRAPYAALPWFWSDIGALKLQIAGLAIDLDEEICARRADGTLQSIWRLRRGRLAAVETLNGPGEHMLARRMITDGFTPDRILMSSGTLEELKDAYKKISALCPVGPD